jgi:hypothetical protein
MYKEMSDNFWIMVAPLFEPFSGFIREVQNQYRFEQSLTEFYIL